MLATQPDIDTISITRTFDGIEAAAHRVISQTGGMASVIKDAKIAVLKKTCQRCLLCYEARPENANSVKGYSGTRRSS